MTTPALISRVDAILSPVQLEDHREYRLMDGEREVTSLFSTDFDYAPPTIEHKGTTYYQGQWSGVSGSLIWYEKPYSEETPA